MIYAPLAPMSFRIAFQAGSVKRFPNAIDALNPKNRFLTIINKLPTTPGVPYNSVIGDRGKGDSAHAGTLFGYQCSATHQHPPYDGRRADEYQAVTSARPDIAAGPRLVSRLDARPSLRASCLASRLAARRCGVGLAFLSECQRA